MEVPEESSVLTPLDDSGATPQATPADSQPPAGAARIHTGSTESSSSTGMLPDFNSEETGWTEAALPMEDKITYVSYQKKNNRKG